MSRRLFEKRAYGQRQTARFNEALGRMGLGAGSHGADPLSRTEHAQALQSVNYGTGWRDLAQHYGSRSYAPKPADLSRSFDLDRGLMTSPAYPAHLNDDVRLSRASERMSLQRQGVLPQLNAYASFKPDPQSSVPMDVQRGRHLEKAPMRRFTFEPDRNVKIRAAISPKAQPVPVPPAPSPSPPRRDWLGRVRYTPPLGPVDDPSKRLWRGSDMSLRHPNPAEPTWASGHFEVANSYAPRPHDRLTAYRSQGISTGYFTPHVSGDTRNLTPKQLRSIRSTATGADLYRSPFFERVVNSSDLPMSRIESQYVRGTQGLYHRRGPDLLAQAAKAPLAQVTETPGMGQRLMDAGKRLAGTVGPWLKRFKR